MLSDRCLSRSVCPLSLSVTFVYCRQTAGWIKMPLGMEVGLGPGDIVLDGDPALPPPPQKNGTCEEALKTRTSLLFKEKRVRLGQK